MVNLSSPTFHYRTLDQILAFARRGIQHPSQCVFLYPNEFSLVLAQSRTVVLAVNRPVDSLAYRHGTGPFRADCCLEGYNFQTQYPSARPDFRVRAVGL